MTFWPPPDIALPETCQRVFLEPGELYCAAEPTIVTTILGSCVAVCLWDEDRRFSGINHFVLPHSLQEHNNVRYGDVSTDRLVEGMLRLGSRKERLRAKLFGGAAVLPVGSAGDTIGDKNVRMALTRLRAHGIPVIAQRTGGQSGLLVRLFTPTGEVLVRPIRLGRHKIGA